MSDRTTGHISDNVVGKILAELKGGADGFEVFYSRESGLSVEAKGASVEALKVRSSEGVGLRVIKDGRAGFGFSSVLTDEALKDMVQKALDGSAGAAPDEHLSFPSTSAAPGDADLLAISDPAYHGAPEEGKIASALSIERAALSGDPRVKRVRKASYGESTVYTRVVNSNGVDSKCEGTYFSGSVTAVAEDAGESQMGWDMATARTRSLIDPAAVGKGAAVNATRLLGARRISTVRCPAVIENTVACEFLEALASSFLGDNVMLGKSMLAGRTGKKVASAALSVWDDGILKGGWATSPFDAEGAASGRRALLKDGVCEGFLYDTYWARRAGVKSTGNAARSGYKGLPSVGTTNLYIEKGAMGFDALLKEMGRGLVITEVLGMHTANTISGDYSVGVAGLWVEGGTASHAVRGLAVSGNILELFSRVASVGSDMRFLGSVGAPSILIEEIEASGQ